MSSDRENDGYNNDDAADSHRRQQEMNMFSAFATEGEGRHNARNSVSVHSETVGESEGEGDNGSFNPNFDAESDSARSIADSSFLAAARADAVGMAASAVRDSGSFAFQSTASNANKVGAVAEQSNLSAAVALLTKDDPTTTKNGTNAGAGGPSVFKGPNGNNGPKFYRNTGSFNNNSGNNTANAIAVDKIPMFAEEVVMPRPLFFGAIVPPRVLRQTRELIQSAMTDHEGPVRLHEMPPSVRNLVGALRTYGYGLDQLLPLENGDSWSKHPKRTSFGENTDKWMGNCTVSTFQPVWDGHVRAERVRDYRARRIQKPSMVSRVSTAPPRMAVLSDNDSEDIDDDSLHAGNNDNAHYVSDDDDGMIVDDDAQIETTCRQHSTGSASSTNRRPLNKNEQFSAWIRQDEDSVLGNMSFASSSVESLAGEHVEEAVTQRSEQETFSQWALGSMDDIGAIAKESPVFKTASDTFKFNTKHLNTNTFQRRPSSTGSQVENDDDSVIDDEQKKQVGVNESLSKAVALLAEDDGPAQANMDVLVEQSHSLLSPAVQDGKRNRPMTNYELTSGCIPFFAIDDSPFPQESDLGVLETKDEVQRAMEKKRSQEIIEKFVPQNVFGPVACPNPATSPDDFHSWNSPQSISLSNRMGVTSGTSVASDPVGLRRQQFNTAGSDPSNRSHTSTPPKPPKHKFYEETTRKLPKRQRFGWWSKQPVDMEKQRDGAMNEDDSTSSEELQLPPVSFPDITIATTLEPFPEKLREDNIPLSRMHAATSMVQSLPYLCDRPPSHRYLQIDTQAIAFPPVKTEIEPLFCSLALYNVDTVSSATTTGIKNSAPIPDLNRCGRVTESLHFDHVVDSEIEQRCAGALWPYALSEQQGNSGLDVKESYQFRGTRCGVFPIPSNLHVANLYAVLIVQKVICEDSDLDPYLKPGKPIVDLEKLKSHAAKNAKRRGHFVVPFAFGVAPLLQVFGPENPSSASSRAVQIPLFHFSDGERQIIDHIMVMLFPRADHKANGVGGPAPVTNGGTAMLVMRNFGYLGLHSVVDSKSSLARDRLVDFTGELQLRRRVSDDDDDCDDGKSNRQDQKNSEDGIFQLRLPPWNPLYLAEPTINGGRNRVDSPSKLSDSKCLSTSKLYAQELAPLPIMLAPSTQITSNTSSGMSRGRPMQQEDIEPFYHTSFCNELLCHPRILHNCPRGTVSIMVELREMEWNESMNSYLAHRPSVEIGPSIHNRRRGPFLVQSAFTSCTPHRSDHQFMDEFKVKLPLALFQLDSPGKRNLCIFFTVFKVKRSKSMWERGAKMIFGSTGAPEDASTVKRVEQVACGFLPIASQSCLIDNGLHDVRVVYVAQSPSQDKIDQYSIPSDSLILVEKKSAGDDPLYSGRDDSMTGDTAHSNDTLISDKKRSLMEKTDSDSTSHSDDSIAKCAKGVKSTSEPISLSVRIVVYSSLHSQNSVLNDLLNQEADLPVIAYSPNKMFMTTLRMGREYLVSNASFNPAKRIAHAREDAMIEPTIAITDNKSCSVPRSTIHILRIMPLLWRSLLCGDGEPDIIWANPASSTPLRVHSFATILHLVGASSLYMSKHGVTQLNGTGKWNVVMLGRVLALLFDEKHLFGNQSVEKFDEKYWLSLVDRSSSHDSHLAKKASPKKRGHVRTTFELGNDTGHSIHSTSVVSNYSSTAGDLVTIPKRVEPEGDSLLESFELDMKTSDDSDDTPSPKQHVKVDTKSDFQHFLRAANSKTDSDIDIPLVGSVKRSSDIRGSEAADVFVQAFGGIPAASNRRYMTAPSSTLSTILEGTTDSAINSLEQSDVSDNQIFPVVDLVQDSTMARDDVYSTNLSSGTRKFRVPKNLSKGRSLKIESEKVSPKTGPEQVREPEILMVPQSDDEMANLGDAFLDKIGVSLGLLPSIDVPNHNSEEKRVGSSHHRRQTQGRSSIDWSLMPTDDRLSQIPTHKDISQPAKESSTDENNEAMSTLKSEESTFIKLPSFVDRLVLIGDASIVNARWFPYAYEVIIMQWAAIFIEQKNLGEKKQTISPASHPEYLSGMSPFSTISEANQNLSHAAVRSIGVAVAGAPMLFEIIKKSLGFRVKSLFTKVLSKKESRITPPLVSLDDTLMLNLVQIVTMVTDACIDSRNFDSWELRQMSIDVNDSVIRFLRDMYSFLTPSCVHRMILPYLSRFVTKEGKLSTDRDSLIGLRCSWEITKLRLNAVTALIRFPDFIKVNAPQMLNWTNWWTSSSTRSTLSFYDKILDRYQTFQLSDIVSNDGSVRKEILVASMRPHWLAEIVVDICLLGTEHAEQYIHHRSASLLHEMFWACSQESILYGISAPVGGMFVTYLEKLVLNSSYLANFTPKSQLRKHIITSGIFVMQSAPVNLLRAVWRKLCSRLPGKGLNKKYGVVAEEFGYDSGDEDEDKQAVSEGRDEPDILGMFSFLNLALRTIEYEGSDENIDCESPVDTRNYLDLWKKEFLLSRSPVDGRRGTLQEVSSKSDEAASSTSRKWQAHDGSIVIVNVAHQIVREMYLMLSKSACGKKLLNPAVRGNRRADHREEPIRIKADEVWNDLCLSRADTVLFIRAVASLYLHTLSLRESDIVTAKTFLYSADVIKIFGINLFLEAVGETHQHWMRVISLHCGARRAQVRVEATDLLELILRSTWECYGSFFRIRLPLLAVQTEVMERIVATAAARYYRDQRRLGHTNVETFTNVGAEASLVPLWRTLDRMQKQPASQNVAFRGALIRMAGKLKKLYRAYVAARVLSFIKNARGRPSADDNPEERNVEAEAVFRAIRISILRVINASEGHSKQFLGFQGTTIQRISVAHYEAVEDALIDAANVFSPTELPEHRVAWLQMLAEFHSSRKKYAEEATCHFHIHLTLRMAARLHGSLWSNTPFLPWTDNIPDPVVYIDGDTSPTADPDYQESELNFDGDEWEYGGQGESSISFRRIFYRVANSITLGNNEFELGGTNNLFFGVTYPSEHTTMSPWISLREMEESMVEEVESAGALFLQAGIVESSRFSWNLATQYYADKFNYAKLSMAYGNLSSAIVSQVPSIDTSLPQEVSAILGRFYRVWFHGGAPDELSGVEFVYRTQGAMRLQEFGEELRTVISTIVPNKTPIHLVLDGHAEDRVDENAVSYSGFRIGPATLEPVHIKVTPLRPMFDRDVKTRGLPDWFDKYVDQVFVGQSIRPQIESTDSRKRIRTRTSSNISPSTGSDGRNVANHEHSRSFSATLFSSNGTGGTPPLRKSVRQTVNDTDRLSRYSSPQDSDLAGVDKFCFVQPKNRSRPKEWWKPSAGDFAERNLRVTQLQVAETFPACVSRQEVVHRLVYLQSPLEAGIDAVCQWCAVLFRTAVATAGMKVLKINRDPGIGNEAAKVVADCIHNSHVKDIGLTLLMNHTEVTERDNRQDFAMDSSYISRDEIDKLQLKLARLIVTFVELLHLLIARNRDKLLDVIKERKVNDGSCSVHGGSVVPSRGGRHISVGSLYDGNSSNGQGGKNRRLTAEQLSSRTHHIVGSEDNQSYQSNMTTTGVRTDSAIAVQSELQRAFISLTKVLYKSVHRIMRDETPRWFKPCGQDNYFSLGTYKQTVIPIAEELCFNANDSPESDSQHPFVQRTSQSGYSDQGYESPRGGGGESAAGGSQESIISRGSERYGFGQF